MRPTEASQAAAQPAESSTQASEPSSPARIETSKRSRIARLLAAVKRAKAKGSSINEVKAVEALGKINQIGEVGIGTVELNSVAEHLRDHLSDRNRVRIKQRKDLRLFLAKAGEVPFILIGSRDSNDPRRVDSIEQPVRIDDRFQRRRRGDVMQMGRDRHLSGVGRRDHVETRRTVESGQNLRQRQVVILERFEHLVGPRKTVQRPSPGFGRSRRGCRNSWYRQRCQNDSGLPFCFRRGLPCRLPLLGIRRGRGQQKEKASQNPGGLREDSAEGTGLRLATIDWQSHRHSGSNARGFPEKPDHNLYRL